MNLKRVLLLALLPSALHAQSKKPDAVRADPVVDAKFPPGMDELRIPSHGAGMNGFIYLTGGAGNHPVVIVLHGFPGNEKNIDIAQAVRRAGYNALYFDYRGSWGSGGTFSFQNSREDVASALAWIRDPANAKKYRFDTTRIAIVGHSMGGWLALDGTAADPNVGCVAALAAWNLAAGVKMMDADKTVRAGMVAYAERVTDPAAGPLRTKGADIVAEMDANAKSWDYLDLAQPLRNRAVLLASATRDSPDEGPAMHTSLATALRKAGATRVQNVKYEDDHGFSAHRVALTDLIVSWLRTDCTAAWKARL